MKRKKLRYKEPNIFYEKFERNEFIPYAPFGPMTDKDSENLIWGIEQSYAKFMVKKLGKNNLTTIQSFYNEIEELSTELIIDFMDLVQLYNKDEGL